MKIIKPSAAIVGCPQTRDEGITLLRNVELYARVSHATEDKQTADSWERFLRAVVIEHGDWSVTEHEKVTVIMIVDRGVSHEAVRHRISSFTQSSTRFINHAKKQPPEFIYPQPDVECEFCVKGYEMLGASCSESGKRAYSYWHQIPKEQQHPHAELVGRQMWAPDCQYNHDWLASIDLAERQYKRLLEQGWRPQEARSVFPNALATKLVMTCNLRNWRYFFQARTCREAHPQMRQVTIPLLKTFQERIPILYDDIVPEQRQADAFSKPR